MSNTTASSLPLSLPPPTDIHQKEISSEISKNRGSVEDDNEDNSITNANGDHDTIRSQRTATNLNDHKGGKKAAPPQPPSYEERCRAALEWSRSQQQQSGPGQVKKKSPLFVPRRLTDFGDGGAYPEIHVAQYPRHMGNPHVKRQAADNKSDQKTGNTVSNSSISRALVSQGTAASSIVAVQVDKDGKTAYDAIVKGGTNKDKLVYTKHADMRGLVLGEKPKEEDIALPTAEEERQEAEQTKAALQALVAQKMGGGSKAIIASEPPPSEFIKYTPRPDAPGYNPSASQRVIQMVQAKVDPLAPPKHRHTKAPSGPAEDPVPVLHAPPTKLTKEERQAWNIPSSISNWKNMRGYTIPLDKRLAADGRNVVAAPTVNNNFAVLSESLYMAERQARKEVLLRAQVQKKIALEQKAQQEEELRKLAQQARLQRGGAAAQREQQDNDEDELDDDRSVSEPVHKQADERVEGEESKSGSHIIPEADHDEESTFASSAHRAGVQAHMSSDERVAAEQREKLRIERKKQREKEMRAEKSVEAKRRRFEEDRDVSEKIALGAYGGSTSDPGTDARLYHQTAGLDSGFGRDDEYAAYTKPLFGAVNPSVGSSIYRPTRGSETSNARTAPVQFEKEK